MQDNMMTAIGYTRVSTAEQAASGAGLAGQRFAIAAECKRRGWRLTATAEDAGYSAKSLRRPGIVRVLEMLEAGEADALIVAKLDRLSRSMMDFTALMELARRQQWAIVALDCAVDTTTPAGEAMANVLATFAQFERRLIGQRTKDALAQKRTQGVRLGRPAAITADIASRIRSERVSGRTLREIASSLNADEIPTAHGGAEWRASSLRHVLRAADG